MCVKSFHMGFTGGARGKEPNTGDIRDAGLILGLGRSPGGGHGNSLQSSCLDRGAWQAPVRGGAESDTTECTYTGTCMYGLYICYQR